MWQEPVGLLILKIINKQSDIQGDLISGIGLYFKGEFKSVIAFWIRNK